MDVDTKSVSSQNPFVYERKNGNRESIQLTYFRPLNLSDALTVLAEHRVQIVGGCTDIFPATTSPVLQGSVLDVTAVEGLRGISQTADGWRMGAATTWSDIIAERLPAAFDGLKLAAREIGSVQIQNSATIAGNLCNASPAADGVPPLLTLDASVELVSRAGTRILPLSDFLRGPRQTDLGDDELLGAVLVPNSAARGGSGFIKLGARKQLIISIVMVAARMVENNGVIEDIAISVGSCGPVAVRLGELEAALKGTKTGPELLALITEERVTSRLSPIDDIRASAEYRRAAAVEIARRLIEQLVVAP